MTYEEKQIHNAVHAELREFEEFKALVKRMREAQIDSIYKSMFSTVGNTNMRIYETAKIKQTAFESEVDEYLKKIEG